MQIIIKEPNPSGAYPAPMSLDSDTPPKGCAIIADSVDMADFYAYNGFVTLTIQQVERTRQIPKTIIEDGKPVTQLVDEPYTIDTVTAYAPNVEAWEEWKASLPDPQPEPPTTEERIAELEATNAELEDALCEMDAMNEERFAAIEDALCEMDME